MEASTGRSSALIVIGIVLFATALAPAILLVSGWLVGNKQQAANAKAFADIVGPLLTVSSLLLASYVAYESWLAPFNPKIDARPYVWRAGPGIVNGFTVTVFITAYNDGALPGTISDFLIEVRFPKKRWLLEPQLFERPSDFTQMTMRPDVKTPLDPSSVEGLFSPISMAGRSQTSRVITFWRGLSPSDFDGIIDSGSHPLRLYARYNERRSLAIVMDATIVFDDGVIEQMKNGQTVSNLVHHRDTNVKAFLPP